MVRKLTRNHTNTILQVHVYMNVMEIPRFYGALCLLITVVCVTPILCARGYTSSIENSLEPNQERDNIVKTIKTEYGDIYDCVGLYQQPAFNNPLLKHHKIQIKQNFALKNKELEKNYSSSNSLSFGLKKACPPGTVPIRRVTREEKLRAEAAFLQHSRLFSSSSPQNNGDPIMALAAVTSNFYEGSKVHGAGGYVSTHNPTVDMQQSSASVISMEYGDDDDFATIRVGWVVYPHLYGDNHTRLYSLWSQRSDGGVQGCFNLFCAGFIQTNPKIPLEMVIDPVSPPQGQQLYIYQDIELVESSGNWVYHFGENKEEVGYWPSQLFTELQHGGDRARWGGMVVSYNAQIFPDMGSGHTDNINGCHFRDMTANIYQKSETNTTLLKLNNNNNNNDGSETNFVVPIKIVETNCYKIGDVSEIIGVVPWKINFWFGGKGGSVDQCKN